MVDHITLDTYKKKINAKKGFITFNYALHLKAN